MTQSPDPHDGDIDVSRQQEKQANEEKAKRANYAATFRTGAGEKVLEDLKRSFCWYGSSYYPAEAGNAVTNAIWRDGARTVINHILAVLEEKDDGQS